MKLKLDENLGVRCVDILRGASHDVATVADEALCGVADTRVIQACHAEQRVLVTLDLDFANPFIFRPSEYSGIAVLRLPRKPSHTDLVAAMHTLLAGLSQDSIQGALWIVQRGAIRQYQPPDLPETF